MQVSNNELYGKSETLHTMFLKGIVDNTKTYIYLRISEKNTHNEYALMCSWGNY